MLRDATPRDGAPLGQILADWIDATIWMPKLHTLQEIQTFLGHLIRTRQVRVAQIAGQPTGFLARNGPYIAALYVSAAARGRGVGSALLAQAKLEKYRALWTFQANTPARAFYARHGLTVKRRTDGMANAERLPDPFLHWSAL